MKHAIKTSDFDVKNTKSLMYLDKFLKILAGQKLNISYDSKAETAYFVPRTNSIVLPTYIFQSKDLFVRFGTHEVAHALYTPKNFYKEHNISDSNPASDGSRDIVIGSKTINVSRILFSCINVVEDIRIERKIRQDFPGLVQAYKKSAADLAKIQDWANLLNCTRADWLKFSIVDKINLKSKFKDYIKHDLSDVEYAVLKYVSNTKTFSDVVIRANYLYSLLKIEQEKSNQSSFGKAPELTQADLDAAAKDCQTMSEQDLKDMIESLQSALDALDKNDILEQQFDDLNQPDASGDNPDSKESQQELQDVFSKIKRAHSESELDRPNSDSIKSDIDSKQQDKFNDKNNAGRNSGDKAIEKPKTFDYGRRSFQSFI